MEGVVVAKSSISNIKGKFLSYRGCPIQHLAEHKTFEQVAFLLWNNRFPKPNELARFKLQLLHEMKIPKEVTKLLRSLPKNVNSMDALRTATSLLSVYDPDAQNNAQDANMRKAVRLLAQMPVMIATLHRRKKVKPKGRLNFAGNFLFMLTGKKPTPDAIKSFDVWLILHAEHTMNASTFSARVTTSTLSDMHSAVTSGIGTLKGPLHGGANMEVLKMLYAIKTPDKTEAYVDALLLKHNKIMGIGHRVYKNGDPRADILREMSRRLSPKNPALYEISLIIERLAWEKIKLKPNVDFFSASVLAYLEIPLYLFPTLFAMSRTVGWTAHIMEQLSDNRLIRPEQIYVGNKKCPT